MMNDRDNEDLKLDSAKDRETRKQLNDDRDLGRGEGGSFKVPVTTEDVSRDD